MAWSRSIALYAAAALAAVSAAQSGGDRRIQPRVLELLAQAERCLQDGRFSEARTVAEMLLLRRDVRFAVDVTGLPEARAAEARNAVRGAVEAWSEALDRSVGFEESPWPSADVRISFVPSVRQSGCEVAGYAVWRRQLLNWRADEFSYQVSADVQVRTVLPGGAPMSEAMMRHTCLHELGHVLGLNDSGRPGEAMSVLSPSRPVARPSQAEADSLKQVLFQAGLFLSEATLQSMALRLDGSA
jgi:hypothetical protein